MTKTIDQRVAEMLEEAKEMSRDYAPLDGEKGDINWVFVAGAMGGDCKTLLWEIERLKTKIAHLEAEEGE